MADLNEQLAEHWRKRCEALQARLDDVCEKYSEHVRTTDHWLRRIQRLQTLQPKDITPEELEAVNDGWYPEFMGSGRIAAVCRGMLREVKSE